MGLLCEFSLGGRVTAVGEAYIYSWVVVNCRYLYFRHLLKTCILSRVGQREEGSYKKMTRHFYENLYSSAQPHSIFRSWKKTQFYENGRMKIE
uniref:Uncharacterized protein n=1 Tax=Rhipicephalus appendiculatus TaxID=34631 RepID=A0A131YEJ3_RHIAP